MANRFLSILSKTGQGILKGADIGAKAGIPIASQVDRIADAIKDIKGKRKADESALADIVSSVEELKATVPDIVTQPKKALESNRFKMTLVGLGVALLVSWGLPPEIAEQAMEVVFYLVSAYVLGDTFRPSKKTL